MKCPNCGAETQSKLCEYCGSEMPQEKSTINITNNYYNGSGPQANSNVDDTVGKCPKCGNSKIVFKRERMGSVTQSSSRKNFFGAGSKGQSVSQSAYRTVGVCQNCGYTWNPNANGVKKNSRKKTWLWVLGWIFIFPLPLTILLLRKKDMKPAVKYGMIAVAWILFLVIGTSTKSDPDATQPDVSSQTEVVQGEQNTDILSVDESIVEQPTANSSLDVNKIEDNKVIYAEDEVVNRFIYEFNEKSFLKINDIKKGNISTKYFGYVDGRYLEMINANDATAEIFCLKINGGQENADKQSMFKVFKEVIKVLDPAITDEIIDITLAEFDNKDVLVEEYVIGDNITVTYVPTKELSYGKNSCRIDVFASNYKD